MLSPWSLTSYFKACYKFLFSPFAPKSCNLVQKSMGYHSEMVAFSKFENLSRKRETKQKQKGNFDEED